MCDSVITVNQDKNIYMKLRLLRVNCKSVKTDRQVELYKNGRNHRKVLVISSNLFSMKSILELGYDSINKS